MSAPTSPKRLFTVPDLQDFPYLYPMIFMFLSKNRRFLPLLSLPFLAWLLVAAPEKAPEAFSAEKVNLALRRTADGLLRLEGDSTSRIPAIEQDGATVWKVRLEQPFNYEALPHLLQSSLEQYGIQRPYTVAVRQCATSIIDLGYHQLDVVADSGFVPCGGREMPNGCHFIEITFLENSEKNTLLAAKLGAFALILAGIAGIWFFSRKKSTPLLTPEAEVDWLEFGHSRLDVAGQVLICKEVRHTLTFREAKLLRLFAVNQNRLLERDVILQQVWADEGILVGRSVDVFVSRLRKKLADDGSVAIVAVHGVGYRLETGKSQ